MSPVCVITGGTSGIGRATAEALARKGFQLGLVCRDPARGERTRKEIVEATGNPNLELFRADLALQDDIRRVASDLLAHYPRIDVLLNDAAVMCTHRQETPDGIEATFAVNHLAYFLLTNLLLERLKQAPKARIVNVASEAHRFGALDFDDLEWRRRRYGSGMACYGTSKLMNVLFTYELARRLELDGTNVTANCLHPGGVNSRLGDHNGPVLAALGKLVKLFLISPEKGAETSVHLASAPELEGVSGTYWAKCRPRSSSDTSRDPALARRLWEVSEERTGLAAG